MTKIIYPVWKSAANSGNDFRDAMINSTAPELMALDFVTQVRIAVVDSDVEAASAKRMECCQQPLPDGMVSVTMNDSEQRGEVEAVLAACVERFTGYEVEETERLTNTIHRAASGERVYGMCQIVFLQRPDHLTEARWLEVWHDSHTQIAIDTQSTFAYRQNVITKSLSDGAPVLHAMIEENFPPEAMTSDRAFYDVDNDEDLKVNQNAMMESCARFIDFDKIDVIPMSEYIFTR